MRRYVGVEGRKSARGAFARAIEEGRQPGGSVAWTDDVGTEAVVPAVYSGPRGIPVGAEELDGWIGPLWVPGKPQPKGSTRAFMVRGRPIITSDNAALKPWAKAIALAYRVNGGPLEAPERIAHVRMRFFVDRPLKHYQGGARHRPLKDDVPLYPGRKPDVDKLARGVLDALAGMAYADDAAVVGIDAQKDYATDHSPGVLLWWRYLAGPVFRKGDSGS